MPSLVIISDTSLQTVACMRCNSVPDVNACQHQRGSVSCIQGNITELCRRYEVRGIPYRGTQPTVHDLLGGPHGRKRTRVGGV